MSPPCGCPYPDLRPPVCRIAAFLPFAPIPLPVSIRETGIVLHRT
jgi:hypothetical protein